MIPPTPPVALVAPAPLSVTMPGLYVAHQMEVGAALELSPDGSFRYQLDYGAVSESAEGRWIAVDGVVLLTSDRFAGAFNNEREFRREPLIVDGPTLTLRRYDTVIRFTRDESPSAP